MIGLDTNVLVRILVPDDPSQTAKAVGLLNDRSEDDPAFITTAAMVELVWVLQRSYGFPAASIHTALDSLLNSSNVQVEHPVLAREAADAAMAGDIDFADYMIAALGIEAGAISTMTFDRKAAKRVPGMELLK